MPARPALSQQPARPARVAARAAGSTSGGAGPSPSPSSSSAAGSPGDPTKTGEWWECPFDELGVHPGTPAPEIRSAFRRLAKLHHPDVSPDPSSAHKRFLRLAEAYAAITGRGASARHGGGGRRGGASTRPAAGSDAAARGTAGAGWSWHDWYWRAASDWRVRHSGGAAAAGPPPAPASHGELQAQLAGMREAAATRKAQRGAAAAAAPGGGGGGAGTGTAAPHASPPPAMERGPEGTLTGIGLQLAGMKRRSAMRRREQPGGGGEDGGPGGAGPAVEGGGVV